MKSKTQLGPVSNSGGSLKANTASSIEYFPFQNALEEIVWYTASIFSQEPKLKTIFLMSFDTINKDLESASLEM